MSPPPEPEEPSPTGGFLTAKYGPLPAWAWGLAALVIAFLYLKYKQNKSSPTTGTQATGTGTTTGTSNALSSNLVGVSEPTPVLDGTYQVTVQPSVDAYSNSQTTTGMSTQGLANGSPPSGTLQPGSVPESPAPNVQPQTQSSSPQTQGQVG